MPKAGKYDYPFFDIYHCIAKLRDYFTVVKTDETKREIVAETLGMSMTGGGFAYLMSAMEKYALIKTGGGNVVITKLAQTYPFQFEWWALSLIDARPKGETKDRRVKKGSDKGVDGWLTFRESANLNLKKIVVQVKGGVHIGAKDIRDLLGTVENTKSAMGIFITLHEPTKPMKQAAVEAEYYTSPTWGHKYPKNQILTIKEILEDKKPIIPHTQLV